MPPSPQRSNRGHRSRRTHDGDGGGDRGGAGPRAGRDDAAVVEPEPAPYARPVSGAKAIRASALVPEQQRGLVGTRPSAAPCPRRPAERSRPPRTVSQQRIVPQTTSTSAPASSSAPTTTVPQELAVAAAVRAVRHVPPWRRGWRGAAGPRARRAGGRRRRAPGPRRGAAATSARRGRTRGSWRPRTRPRRRRARTHLLLGGASSVARSR